MRCSGQAVSHGRRRPDPWETRSSRTRWSAGRASGGEEIDRAAQRLGGDKQFKKKKKQKSNRAEAGVYTHKGTAARIDAAAAPAPGSPRTLPGLAPPGGHDDHDHRIGAPKDAVCSSDGAARGRARARRVDGAAELDRRLSPTLARRGRPALASDVPSAAPPRAARRCFLLRRTRRQGCSKYDFV